MLISGEWGAQQFTFADRSVGWQEGGEGSDIKPGVAAVVELNRMLGEEKIWRAGLIVPNGQAETTEAVAQVRPGRALRAARPQHLGQGCAAAMSAIRWLEEKEEEIERAEMAAAGG